MDTHLRKVPLFANLPAGVFPAVLEFLKQRVKLIRVHPGQVIFREGDRADHFYMVRIGFVKVSRRSSGGEHVANYIGPDEFFGEIGLLAQIPEIQRALEVSDIRTATCTALDHVDLVRIDGEDFHWLLRAFLLDRTVLRKSLNRSNPCSSDCSTKWLAPTARRMWRTGSCERPANGSSKIGHRKAASNRRRWRIFAAGVDGSLEFARAGFGKMHAL